MSEDKRHLRHIARETRRALDGAGLAAALALHADALQLQPGTIVGAYHALPEEADPARLLARLMQMGCHIAFPRIAGRGLALDYHRVPDGAAMMPGAHGIQEPLAHWPRVTPDLLLVPLLAFDARGHRLGYGGGFYDRTLALLKIPAIGIAHAAQELSSLPVEAHDMALDAVLTERGLRRFR